MMFDEALATHDLFLEDRPVLDAHDHPHILLKYIHEELKELEDAIHTKDRQEIGAELADVCIFVYTLSQYLHIHLPTEIAEKVAFNITRYTADLFQGDISYEEAKKLAKRNEKERKRDFYSIPRDMI